MQNLFYISLLSITPWCHSAQKDLKENSHTAFSKRKWVINSPVTLLLLDKLHYNGSQPMRVWVTEMHIFFPNPPSFQNKPKSVSFSALLSWHLMRNGFVFKNFIYGAYCHFPVGCCKQERRNDAHLKTPRVSGSSTLSLIPFTEAWAVNEYILLDIGMTSSHVFSAVRWQIISLAITMYFSYSWNPGVGRNIKSSSCFISHLPTESCLNRPRCIICCLLCSLSLRLGEWSSAEGWMHT